MVTLNKIYTRQGDDGSTRIVNKTTAKWSQEIEVIGSLDELNAFIGEARAFHGIGSGSRDSIVKNMLTIQNDLFDIGSIIAGSGREFSHDPVRRLEQQIDAMNKRLEPLTSFIIPGATYSSAKLHMCRAVCRRAERQLWSLIDSENPDISHGNIAAFLNRLSDWFFVAARVKNTEREDLWVPGANQ